MSRVVKTSAPVAANTDSGQGKALPIIVVLSTLLFVALAVAGYFYYQYRQSPKVQSAEEIKNLKEEISAIFELPTDEEPTLATVADREKLAEQPFFQKAENGDKVLIYSNSGRAILYRPSVKKIIDVTMVNVAQPVDAPISEAAPTAPETAPGAAPAIVRVTLYNGSKTIGITNSTEAALRSAMPNATVSGKAAAAKDDYLKTLVIDLAGTNGTAALSVATAVGGEVGSLPEGEKAPTDADILVIVGNGK